MPQTKSNLLKKTAISKTKNKVNKRINKLELTVRLVVRKKLRFLYKKYFLIIIDIFKTLINQSFWKFI